MTGTGTQAEPYIVDTWEDFRTAVGTSGAYVEVKPNTVWNFNEIAPTGLPETTINCAQINGNDCELWHPYVRDNFLFYNTSGAIINKLHLFEFNVEAGSARAGIYRTSSIHTQGEFHFCKFSGAITGVTYSYFHHANHQASDIYYNCSLDIKAVGNFEMVWGSYMDYPKFTDCNIKLDCSAVTLTQGMGLVKSQLEYSADTAIQLYIDGGSALSVIYPKTAGGSILNDAGASAQILADSSGISSDTTVTNVTLCTSEQLKDADYLTSIGFLTGG